MSTIFYSVNSKNDFKDKDIIVCGGGDSTFDWANELSSLAKSVAIIHRRNDFRAKAASVEKARQNNVKFFTPYIFLEISEEKNGIVKKIRLEHAETKEQIEVGFDALIVQYGSIIEKEKFENLHLKLNEQNKFIVDNKMETSVEGIFAAGDCNHHDAKIKNLVSSIYEAMQAIINIEKIINNKVMANRGW